MNEDKASRYQRLRRQASMATAMVRAGLLVGVVLSGGSISLRNVASSLTGDGIGSVVLFVLAITICSELLVLPLGFYQGVTLERRYGLSSETVTHWWVNQLKARALGVAAVAAGGVAVSLFLRWAPDLWWLLTAGSFVAVTVLLTQYAPVVLLPLFDATEPLRRESLVRRLMALAERAQTEVLGVFEWRLGARTRKANAVLAGIGRTRRILVSDTLLADHSDDEIEVVLAHELAHHVHHDIWTSLALEALFIGIAAWLADFVLSWSVVGLGLDGKADIAGLPIIALVFGACSALSAPVTNILSRAHERRADRYALELTGNVPAFVSAMKRLGAQNLSDDAPSPLVVWLFYTHPPVRARIAAAQSWAPRR